MNGKDEFYIILEVGRTASVNDIKRAFRKLARRFHPDINPGNRAAEEQFKKITEAYEILSDPPKRRFYDENGFYTDGVLEVRTRSSAASFSFQGFDFSPAGGAPGLGDGFSELFSPKPGPTSPERGQDLEYPVSLSFADSIRGLKTRLSVYRKHACGACLGAGRVAVGREVCGSCGGTGKAARMKGHLRFNLDCAPCGGTGNVRPVCQECRGEGRVPFTDIVDVEVPPGVNTGSRVRFPGKGDAGRLGAPPGDLYIITNVAPHPVFDRVGDNIRCAIPIAFWEAALGAKIEVPTVDGSAVIRIPPGTQSGQTFRMRGKGAPSLSRPGLRGDQFVAVDIVVPRIADERSKEILRELARLNPNDPRQGIL